MTSAFLLALWTNRRFFIDWVEPIEDMDEWGIMTGGFQPKMAKRVFVKLEDYITAPCFDWSFNSSNNPDVARVQHACNQSTQDDNIHIGPLFSPHFDRMQFETLDSVLKGVCVRVYGYTGLGKILVKNPHYTDRILALDKRLGNSAYWELESMLARFLVQPNEELEGLLSELDDVVWTTPGMNASNPSLA